MKCMRMYLDGRRSEIEGHPCIVGAAWTRYSYAEVGGKELPTSEGIGEGE